MYSKKIGIAAKKATSVLSAIAASSFLGLPALSQTNPNYGTTQCVPATSQSNPSSSNSSSTSSASTYSNPTATSNSTDTNVNSAADAGTPGSRNFPNQTDPRAVPPALQGTSNNLTGTSIDSTSGMSSSTSRMQVQGSGATSTATDPSVAPSGSSTDRFSPNMGRTGNQSASNPSDSANPSIQGSPNQSMTSNGALTRSSATGTDQTYPADSAGLGTQQPSNQGSVSGAGMSSGAGGVNSADSSTYSPNSSSGQLNQSRVGDPGDSSRAGAYTSNPFGGQQPLYGNILGRGGSTNGGGARIRVEVASNPDWVPGGRGDTLTSYFDQAQAGENQLSANAMTGGNPTSSTQSSNIQTEGVTTGGQAANQSSTAAYEAGSSGMAGQSSSSMTNNGAIANCPPGMVPIQSSSNQQYNQQSSPNQPSSNTSAPGRAFTNTRQTPLANP